MKKNLLKILCGALCACLLFTGLTACSGAKWSGTTLNSWGETTGEYARGGFVAETENYLYYINGVATSTNNNTFGTPVKGALMAVDKTDLTSKTEVVVPKLFASKNYEQGLFISGNYVYYGTPSTDKTSDGTVANSEMMFMRTKLDGTESVTFLTVSSLSAEYRFVEKEGVVYILYIDSDSSAIKCFNTATNEDKEVAVTDATVQLDVDDVVNEEHGESLADKYFVGDSIIYTVTVYNEVYNEQKIEDNDGTRSTANYNKVYRYNAGDAEPTLILDGRESETTYKIDLVNEQHVFFTATKNAVGGISTSYVATLDGITTAEKANADCTSSDVTKIIVGEAIYSLADGKVYKNSVKKAEDEKTLVAVCSTISTMLFVRNNELYYVNSSTQLAKIELDNENAHEVILTENTVVTNWYEPVIITLNQTDYLFYADSSSYGLSYVKYLALNDEDVVAEDTDDDEKDDKWYIPDEKTTILGSVSDKDLGSIMTAKINALANELSDGNIEFDVDDDGAYVLTEGKFKWAEAEKIRSEYEGLTEGVKANVDDTALDTLADYERAIEMASLYYKLNGIEELSINGDDQAKRAAYQQAYEQVKDDILEFQEADDFDTITGYFKDELNLLWSFQKAQELFETEE